MRVIFDAVSERDTASQSDKDNPFRIIGGMSTEAIRLQKARAKAGYPTPADAARAMGVPLPTYYAHENGAKGLSRSGKRYARFFRVSYDWLMNGTGEMKPAELRSPGRITINLYGSVGAGFMVEPISNTSYADALDEIELPDMEFVGALKINGDSQYPRYLHGEVVMYDLRPVTPDVLKGKYAVVDCLDGRRVLKILRKETPSGAWQLDSHNAPSEEVEVLAAYRVLGTLS